MRRVRGEDAGDGVNLVFQPKSIIPHPPPPQCGMPQELLAGQAGSRVTAVWAAGTLMARVSRTFPQEGQAGFSSPRISSSNSLPQWLHVYS
jgi:hypothetical protein